MFRAHITRYHFGVMAQAFVSGCLLLLASSSFARDGSSVRYEAEAYFDYMSEGIRGFSAQGIQQPAVGTMVTRLTEERPSMVGTRTLGLTRLRLATHFRVFDQSELTLVLRPDALNRDPDPLSGERRIVRDFDGRAGEVHRSAASLKALDAYQLHIMSGSVTQASMGVFEQLAPVVSAYRNPLRFGLETMLPEKFFALRLRWGDAHLSLPTAQPQLVSPRRYELWAYQSHEDRVEVLGEGRRTFDQAPIAHDPYVGAATVLRWLPNQATALSGALGFGTTGRSDARVEELWSNLAMRRIWQGWVIPIHTAVDYRFWQENWTKTSEPRPKLVHQSLGATSRWHFLPEGSGLLGFHLGEGEGHKTDNLRKKYRKRGWQIDLGYQHELAKAVAASLIYSYESRTMKGSDDQTGGFTVARPDKDHINRLAVSFHYTLGATL